MNDLFGEILDHFQNIKNGLLDPNYVRNDILWIFVGHIDENIIVNIYFFVSETPPPPLFQTENTALKLPFWKGHHTFLHPSYMYLTENRNRGSHPNWY